MSKHVYTLSSSNGFRKMNRRKSSKKNSKKKIIDHLLFEKNEIFTFFSRRGKHDMTLVYVRVYKHIDILHTPALTLSYTHIDSHKRCGLNQTGSHVETKGNYR